MLKLEVMHYKGSVPPQPIAAQFDRVGGTIGRNEANTLVLPDPQRFISRTHAKIKFLGDRYVIEDHGSSTPVMVNGRSLGKGTEAALAHGDELIIGEYNLRAIVQLAVVPADAPAIGRTAKVEDPMAMFGMPASGDPFADLIPPPTPGAKGFDSSGLKPGPGGIPADFDPFSGLGGAAASVSDKSVLSRPADVNVSVAPQSQSLEALFGIGNAPANDPLLGGAPEASVDPMPLQTSVNLDPLAAFDSKPAPHNAPSQRNDAPEVFGSFVPPKPVPEPRVAQPPVAPVQEVMSEILAPTPRKQPEEAAAPRQDVLVETQRMTITRQTPDAYVSAFLKGAGIEDFNLPGGVTPQNMQMLGEVLRETVQAMLDLLLARALLKRELRAEVTMLVARENNPLKFSPNVEAALAHLLAPQRGYMEPMEAVRDACNDLRSNQLAFMTGVRAALAGLLQRFSPEQLEQRLKQKTVLDSVLPMNRRAKMWDLFIERYEDVAKDAEDNFHQLFGREFLRAYEAQIAKFAKEEQAKAPKGR